MTTGATHNVFISHHHKDQEDLDRLKNLMKQNGYDIRDSSIDESEPNQAKDEEYIKSILRSRIDWAGTVIVLIGDETHTRPWVNWEIECAHTQGKPIVGIFAQGAKESDIPENFELYGRYLVGWNSKNLMDAIRGKYNGPWEAPDGAPRQGHWPKNRDKCS